MVDLSEDDLLDYHEIVSKTFSGENEGHQFYNDYAAIKGFSVSKCYLQRDKTTNEICMGKFVCSRQKFCEEKHMKKRVTCFCLSYVNGIAPPCAGLHLYRATNCLNSRRIS
jgi:hypothetical protein